MPNVNAECRGNPKPSSKRKKGEGAAKIKGAKGHQFYEVLSTLFCGRVGDVKDFGWTVANRQMQNVERKMNRAIKTYERRLNDWGLNEKGDAQKQHVANTEHPPGRGAGQMFGCRDFADKPACRALLRPREVAQSAEHRGKAGSGRSKDHPANGRHADTRYCRPGQSWWMGRAAERNCRCSGGCVLPEWAPDPGFVQFAHPRRDLRDVNATWASIAGKRCGKTMLSILGELVNRPVVAANISSRVLS
jgi:hypothetical protein